MSCRLTSPAFIAPIGKNTASAANMARGRFPAHQCCSKQGSKQSVNKTNTSLHGLSMNGRCRCQQEGKEEDKAEKRAQTKLVTKLLPKGESNNIEIAQDFAGSKRQLGMREREREERLKNKEHTKVLIVCIYELLGENF